MHSIRLVAGPLVALFAVACIKLPDIESAPSAQTDGGDPDGGSQSNGDGGRSDGGMPDGGDSLPASIIIESPAATVFTKDTVEVRIAVSGITTESVEVLANDTLLSTLSPPFTYTWDTQGVPEGTYSLRARTLGTPAPVTSEARTVIVDRTPPQVTLRSPAPSSSNVSIRETIQAQFSEALDSTTVTDQTITLSVGSTHLAKIVNLSADGKTLTITPTPPPSAPSQVSVTFAPAVADLAHNSLLPPSTAWSWNAPAWLTLADGLGTSASNPSLALDPTSNPFVAWAEGDIHVSRFTPMGFQDLGGTLWANPASTPANDPSLQITRSGAPIVAWSESDGIAENIYVRAWVTDKWQALGGSLSTNAGATDASFPSLCIRSDGTPIVAWSESDGTARNIYVRQWDGSNWQQLGTALSANPGNTDANHVKMVLDSTGSPVVAWQESDGTAVNIYVKRWAGATWQSVGLALSAYPGATDVQSHALALDSNDAPVIAWSEDSGSNGYDIHVSRWSNNNWHAVGGTLTSGIGTRYTDGISLAVTSQDLPLVSWAEDVDFTGNGSPSLQVWRWTQFAWQYVASFGIFPGNPTIALDSTDTATLSWRDSGQYGTTVIILRQNR